MIYILSWTTTKHKKKKLSRPLHSKLKKIQGPFKDLHRNLRTFQDYANPVITLTRGWNFKIHCLYFSLQLLGR